MAFLRFRAHVPGTAIVNVSAATERGGNSTVALPFCVCTALNGWLWMFLGYS